MKVLFINGHLNTGGVEKSLVDILTHIDTKKYDVDLLLLEEAGDYASLLPPEIHVELKSLKNTYGPLIKCLLRCVRQRDWICLKMRMIFLIMKLLGQDKISLAKKMLTDNVHYDCVVGFRRGICTQIASHAVNADRCITWWHHGEFNTDAQVYYEEVKNCKSIVAVSQSCQDFVAENVPAIRDKIITIPNFIDVNLIQEKANDLVPYENGNRFQIVSVGGLVPEKHFCNAIYAAKKLKEMGIKFQWHLVGEGCVHRELRNQVLKENIEDCFIMEGNQPNPYPYMKNADLFVHPSYVESQGIVILEAMALGVPCVVTKSLGPCEFIQNGVNGILTEQSPESLFEKVLEMIQNQGLYQKIKSNTRCPEQFQAESVIKKIEALIEGENT